MDLSPGQQKALFVVVVVALAGLGIYLLAPHGNGSSGQHAGAVPPATHRPAPATQAAGAASAPAPSPAGSPSVNIYRWLPFTQQDLARASAVTTQFAADYNTFTYNESAASYVARMSGLITAQLGQKLENSFATLGVAQTRSRQKQISTGTASIDSLRAFGSSSITFVVTAIQKLTGTQGSSQTSSQYAITVTNSGGSWQVYDIELASAGNS
ncbi:MAG TPA: hypothetical protein VE733_17585 [Streptosporangiaceae bacterium]|jgi:hypothetical protein|nr:hypothetical protein [Streptosporangiaceae bacterium]